MVAVRLIAAVGFTWLGMVLAISFLEAPLKFGAPDVTVRIGLGIGRIVFRALNVVEIVFAVALVVAGATGRVPTGLWVAVGIAAFVLLVQLLGVRPVLNRRSDRILAGEIAPRSRVHFAYIAAELVKVAALIAVGVLA